MDRKTEDLLRAEYERCHPGDTFEALKRRSSFSKEDRRLLEDWREAILSRVAVARPGRSFR